MSLYTSWIEKMELEGFLLHSNLKHVHEMDWGLESLGLPTHSSNPLEMVKDFNAKNLETSKSFFEPPVIEPSLYHLVGDGLRFPSSILSGDLLNDMVYCRLFPSSHVSGIIVVVHHWNADVHQYDRICERLQKIGLACVRYTLPYHGERSPAGIINSARMVSANIGLTIRTMQQSVQDIIRLVRWLKIKGYERIGILGASLGSCAAFLAAAHDPNINGFFANLMSSYFGDVVWTGLSTQHIRKSLEGKISREDLRAVWLLNSPMVYLRQSREYNPALKTYIVIGKYDTTFRLDLSLQILGGLRREGVSTRSLILPCGHYSLGRYHFKVIDAIVIARFFRSLFR